MSRNNDQEPLTFKSKPAMRLYLSENSASQVRDFRVRQSDKKRYHAICRHANDEECQFSLTAKFDGTRQLWTVTKKNMLHTCITAGIPSKERVRGSTFNMRAMADMIKDVVQAKHNTPVKVLQKLIERYCSIIFLIFFFDFTFMSLILLGITLWH